MSWYDKYKEECILIQQEEQHNKFWAGRLENKTVYIRWGRLGTKGQSQEKEFAGEYAAANFLQTKFNEKKRKGYTDRHRGKQIDGPVLEKLAVEAAIVGTSNKCHDMQWVEIAASNPITFERISEERLFDPACTPGLLVSLETKKEYGGKTSFNLLFTGDAAYVADAVKNAACAKIEKTDKLYELTKKVEEAVGRSLS